MCALRDLLVLVLEELTEKLVSTLPCSQVNMFTCCKKYKMSRSNQI